LFKEIKYKVLPTGLMGRSMMIIVVPLLLLLLVTSFVFYSRHWEGISKRFARSFAGDLNAMVELLDHAANSDEQQLILRVADKNMDIKAKFYPNKALEKGLKYSDLDLFDRKFYSFLQRGLKKKMAIMSSGREGLMVLHLSINDGVLEVTVPERRFFSLTTSTFLLWIFIIGLFLFGIAGIFLKNQVRFVSELSNAADMFGKGQDIVDFKPRGAAEVRQAGIAFLKMKNRIQRQISERTMMLAGISHDLRTPLTRMKLQLAMMDGKDVEELNLDISEMEKMIDGYLAFIKGGGRGIAEPTEITPFIEDIVAKYKKQGAMIDLNIEDAATVKIRRSDFARAIGNIINNAVKYAKNVTVLVRKEYDSLYIIISDDGPGIPEDARNDVFKAFYRLDASRNLNTGGVGLGLTIAKDTVLAHGGDMFLGESSAGGLKVTVNIPV